SAAEHAFKRIGYPVAVGVADDAAQVDRVAVEYRLDTRHLEVLEGIAEVDEPRRGATVEVDADFALNLVGAEYRPQCVDDGVTSVLIMHRSGVVDHPIVVAEGQAGWQRWRGRRGRRDDGGLHDGRSHRRRIAGGEDVRANPENGEGAEQRPQPARH